MREEGTDWTGLALAVSAAWIAVALCLSLLLRVPWLAPGDFDFATAMHYHGLMVPLLVMICLLTVWALDLRELRGRLYPGAAIAAVVLVGPASLVRSSEGLSVVGVVQVAGMAVTDVLALILLVALVSAAFRRRSNAALWAVIFSLAAVLVAAPLGHMAGWGADIGIGSLPCARAFMKVSGLEAAEFQEGLVSSHSHLIAAATVSALVGLAALLLGYEGLRGWRSWAGRLGAWLLLASVIGAAAIYLVSAFAGWEPPTLFVCGPEGENGMPLDDVVLTVGALGWLFFIAALARRGERPLVRAAAFANWACAFVGAVALGVYIEFHEGFFGGGEPPAPGAANDQAFIRAHLVYAFMILPIVLAFLLAVGSSAFRSRVGRAFSTACLSLALVGTVVGLAGEIVWVAALNKTVFAAAMLVMGAAVVAGAICLCTGRQAAGPRLLSRG